MKQLLSATSAVVMPADSRGTVRAGRLAQRPAALLAAWMATLAVLYGLVVRMDYPLRDADSTLYESISQSLVDAPLAQWIAPRWPPGRSKTGPFLEHTAFLFWPAAALGTAGFERGALLANFVYFLLSLYVLYRLACAIASPAVGWLAVAGYVASPIGVQYEIRANHELAWGLAFLGGFWCLAELQRHRGFGVAFGLWAALAVLVKGALALTFFPVMAAWWLAVSGRRRDLIWFIWAAVAVAGTAGLYELVHRVATGGSFLTGYAAIQSGYVLGAERGGFWSKASIPVFYALNLTWFALPSSAVLVAGACVQRWRHRMSGLPFKLLVWSGGVQVALLSLMSHCAVRYVFPVFLICPIAAGALLVEVAPGLRARFNRWVPFMPYVLMAALLAMHPIRIWIDIHFYRFVNTRI